MFSFLGIAGGLIFFVALFYVDHAVSALILVLSSRNAKRSYYWHIMPRQRLTNCREYSSECEQTSVSLILQPTELTPRQFSLRAVHQRGI